MDSDIKIKEVNLSVLDLDGLIKHSTSKYPELDNETLLKSPEILHNLLVSLIESPAVVKYFKKSDTINLETKNFKLLDVIKNITLENRKFEILLTEDVEMGIIRIQKTKAKRRNKSELL